jgi:hypothetical protein
MATYSSYKKITTNEIVDGSLVDANFDPDAAKTFGVRWIYGSPGACTSGCCCLWTVPSNVRKITFELWGAGGNGNGSCSCNRCHHFQGAQGGSYNTKTIASAPGCQYTVCAGGVYPCYSRECTACNGCTTYVNGYNLSGFCACGGETGRANTAWTTQCNSYLAYCRQPGDNNGDFYQITMAPGWDDANIFCHCHNQSMFPGSAALIGTTVQQQIRECWIRCGCWTVPYGSGGQGAMNTYCGSGHCGQGGTGGSGLVKITYI